MPAGQLYINGSDAYTTYGVSLSDEGIATLMAPLTMKEDIVNESRLEHGTRRVSAGAKVAEREISLPVHLTAKTKSEYMTKYADFRAMLETGTVNISTAHESGVVYKCKYVSCTQFTQYLSGIAKLMLRLREPNPKDRSDSPSV